MKIKAAVLYESGKPLVVENDIEAPSLNRGKVLVKVFYSGVCHSQLMEARGRRGEKDLYLPHLMGHEASGEVVDIGEGVTKVKQGDRVILTWIKGEGLDAPGALYKKDGKTINSGPVTTFSEYTVVSENRCVPMPEGIPMDIGSLFGCAVLTGAGLVVNEVQPEDGSTLAVFGVGGVGLSALIATGLYKCSKVIAVDIEDSKLEMAGEFGATHLVNSRREDPVKKIYEITGGKGVDYAVESAASAKVIEQAFQSVRKGGGLCVFASHPDYRERVCIDPFDLICGKQIRGSWGGASKPDRDIPRFAGLYREGKLPLDRLISHRYPLEQINQALSDIEQRKVSRALIEVCKVGP